MAEYIEKTQLLEYLYSCQDVRIDIALEIANFPAANVAPVKHGKWLYKGYVCGDTAYQCSACGEIEWRTICDRLKYCPFCGAIMDLEA